MKIQVGKYYQGDSTNVIVKALDIQKGKDFKGIVIVQGTNNREVGSVASNWNVNRFNEISYVEKTTDLFPIY